jgi:hypothetical protein
VVEEDGEEIEEHGEVELQLRLVFSSRGFLLDMMKLSRVALRILGFLLSITIYTIHKRILSTISTRVHKNGVFYLFSGQCPPVVISLLLYPIEFNYNVRF